ncbi:hydroxymethylbilane synthase [Candidatus Latescibacterota bacterium]
MKQNLILGSRGSNLALKQTGDVKKCLENKFPYLKVNITIIKTEGDKDLKSSLASMGGRGVFVQSIEKALLEKKIDAAVHSLKDLPSNLTKGLILGASPERVEPRDVFVSREGTSLASFTKGSVVGTGSPRRRMQLDKICPGLEYKNIRGNIETRLDKLNNGGFDAIVLAGAAIKRLGMNSINSEFLDVDMFVPAPCQGAIGIECRADDKETIEILKAIDNPEVRVCVDAERLFINILGMGCHMPVGAYAALSAGGISFTAFVGSDDWGMIKKTVKLSKERLSERVKKLAEEFRMEIEIMNSQYYKK